MATKLKEPGKAKSELERAREWNQKYLTPEWMGKLLAYAVSIGLLKEEEANRIRKGIGSSDKREYEIAIRNFTYLTKGVQHSLNIKEDGACGPQTIAAIAAIEKKEKERKEEHEKEVIAAVVSLSSLAERERTRHPERYKLARPQKKVSLETQRLLKLAEQRKKFEAERAEYRTNCTCVAEVEFELGPKNGPKKKVAVLIKGGGSFPGIERVIAQGSKKFRLRKDKKSMEFLLRALRENTAEIIASYTPFPVKADAMEDLGRWFKEVHKRRQKIAAERAPGRARTVTKREEVIAALHQTIRNPDKGPVTNLRGIISRK